MGETERDWQRHMIGNVSLRNKRKERAELKVVSLLERIKTRKEKNLERWRDVETV